MRAIAGGLGHTIREMSRWSKMYFFEGWFGSSAGAALAACFLWSAPAGATAAIAKASAHMAAVALPHRVADACSAFISVSLMCSCAGMATVAKRPVGTLVFHEQVWLCRRMRLMTRQAAQRGLVRVRWV